MNNFFKLRQLYGQQPEAIGKNLWVNPEPKIDTNNSEEVIQVQKLIDISKRCVTFNPDNRPDFASVADELCKNYEDFTQRMANHTNSYNYMNESTSFLQNLHEANNIDPSNSTFTSNSSETRIIHPSA